MIKGNSHRVTGTEAVVTPGYHSNCLFRLSATPAEISPLALNQPSGGKTSRLRDCIQPTRKSSHPLLYRRCTHTFWACRWAGRRGFWFAYQLFSRKIKAMLNQIHHQLERALRLTLESRLVGNVPIPMPLNNLQTGLYTFRKIPVQ